MRWGDTQTLLSVIIGLNLGYYAFKEIRGPHVDRLQENLDKIGVQVRSSMSEARILRERIGVSEGTEVTSLFFEFVKLNVLATALRSSANNIIRKASSIARERRLGFSAMLVAIAALLLLIVSTFRYDAGVSHFIVYATIVVGFIPIIVAIAMNYMILARISTYENKLSEIADRLIRAIERLSEYQQKLILEEGADQPHAG
jgi:hypothetical protein